MCPELTDVYCYAKKVPTTSSDTFEGSLIEYATLHVSNSAIDLYRTTDPWNNFGNIVPITGYKIVYVIDGEEFKIVEYGVGDVITPEPAPTKEGYTFIGQSEIPETMPAHDVIITGVFTKTLEQCATPTISYANGKLKYECKTPGVEFVTTIANNGITRLNTQLPLGSTAIVKIGEKAVKVLVK